MDEAVQEVKSKICNDIGVSVDGTYHKRGFTSLNGNVAAISIDTGRIVDSEMMSRYCQTCVSYQYLKKSDPDAYELFRASHEPGCMINHKGSAPAMEVEGTKAMFNRSLKRSGLRYINFLGDGDTKSFVAVENTYPGMKVKKFECIGQIQKRVGNRLRKLKKEVKGLGGKGRLTDSIIDKLQNYYGIAIRKNTQQAISGRI